MNNAAKSIAKLPPIHMPEIAIDRAYMRSVLVRHFGNQATTMTSFKR